MHIQLTLDSVDTNVPANFLATMQTAADMIASAYSGYYTINLRVGWGSFRNVIDPNLTSSSGAYANSDAGDVVSVATIRTWLAASSSLSHDDSSGQAALAANVANLPANNGIYVTSAQERALGQFTNATFDGSVAFGKLVPQADWISVALHEMTHAIGRLTSYYEVAPVVLDLFRYDFAGHFQWTGGLAADVSLDGGTTHLANFSTTSDYSDFVNDSLASNDPYDAFYSGATLQSFTNLDKRVMDVIGFTRSTIRDYSGDGTADVFWRNDSTGHTGIWTMNNNVQTWHDLGGSGTDHKVVGIGDFNGDGTSDVFWRNDTTGHVGDWTMNNGVQTWHDLGGSGTDHKVVGIGDFNGDGTSDILWRNDTTGHVGDWTMNNNVATWHDLGGSGTDHKVVGIGDFNGDGTSDILWRNDTTGHVGDWTMNNNVATWHDLGASDTNFKVVGIGDFNGDGTSDILWRNDTTGQVTDWTMNNNVATLHNLGGSGTDHKVVAIGDFNGDGTSDIFWRNDTTGHVGDWTMNNNVATWHDLGGSGTDHKVKA